MKREKIMGKISNIDWDEIMKDAAVTEVTRMAPSNTAVRHTAETDRELLEFFDSQREKWLHIIELSMRDINERKR